MKRYVRIGLRVLGVALVIFVLSRIQLRDQLEWPDGRVEKGTVVPLADGSVGFLPEGQTDPLQIATHAPNGPRTHKGVITIVREADVSLLLIGFVVFGPITLISITRWWMLLRAVGLPIQFMEALRLSYIGFFFNAAVPGLTGGDVVKGVYIARGSENPYKAFLSVFVDRAIGLFGLALLAGVVVTMHLGQEEFRQVAALVYGALAVASVGGCVVLSRRLRRLLRLEQILTKLPFGGFLSRIDQAIRIYRDAPRTVLVAVFMSITNHSGIVLMVILFGRALGIENPASHFFAIAPLCFIVASIPLVPGGWGMREGAFAYFFASVGISPESSVPTSVLLGLAQLVWFMIGGPVFIARPDRVSKREIEDFNTGIQSAQAGSEPT
ncbi:YbhN family protein [Myxococcota bacterium]